MMNYSTLLNQRSCSRNKGILMRPFGWCSSSSISANIAEGDGTMHVRYTGALVSRTIGGTWVTTSADPAAFRVWLNAHQEQIRVPGVPGGFGNHRKYQSLDAYSDTGTGAAFETYVNWVRPPRTHAELIGQALQRVDWNPRRAFRELYNSMNHVASFGRTARFDYLAMIGKLELAAIEPDSTYMQGSTGPLSGARLLFGVHHGAAQLDQWLIELEAQLGVGMQVLEDALCNWQKSPDVFVPFREQQYTNPAR